MTGEILVVFFAEQRRVDDSADHARDDIVKKPGALRLTGKPDSLHHKDRKCPKRV
jgi:hypothetical protein